MAVEQFGVVSADAVFLKVVQILAAGLVIPQLYEHLDWAAQLANCERLVSAFASKCLFEIMGVKSFPHLGKPVYKWLRRNCELPTKKK
jgi:hypothetical protein